MKKRYDWVIMAFLFSLGIINFADKAVIGFAAVPIMKELNLDAVQWGLVGSAFFWFFSISSVVVGILSDKIGTKKIIGGMASIWAVVQFSTLFVFNLPYLILIRTILGAGEGPSYAISLHTAAKWFPPQRRAFAYGVLTVGSLLGPAIFAPLLIFMITSFGWRSAFVLMGGIGLIWLLLWLWQGKEKPEDVGLPAVEVIQVQTKEKIKWTAILPTLLTRNFIFIVIAGFAGYWGLTLMIVWIPPYLVQVHNLNLQWIVGLPWIVSAIVALSLGTLSDRLLRKTKDSRKARVYVMTFSMFLSALFFYLTTTVNSVALVILFICLGPAFAQVQVPLGGTIISEFVNPRQRGSVQGIYMALTTIAGLLAPVITGVFIQKSGGNAMIGFNNGFLFCSILIAASALLLWMFVNPNRNKEKIEYSKSETITNIQ